MYSEILKNVINAALSAGREILSVYNSAGFDVEYKKDSSPLTAADRKSHNKIMSFLKESSLPVLSEEGKEISYAERSKWARYWLVDPLDGTKEFIKRNGEFTVNIALVESGIPVLGVVYIPVTDTLYFAESGRGAFIRQKAFGNPQGGAEKIEAACSPDNNLVIIASRSHINEQTEEYIRKFEEKGYKIKTINKGSSLKLCKIADGTSHIYPRFGPTMEWDTAAAHAVCSEAGAVVLDMETKKEMVYNKENLLNNFFLVYPKAMEEALP